MEEKWEIACAHVCSCVRSCVRSFVLPSVRPERVRCVACSSEWQPPITHAIGALNSATDKSDLGVDSFVSPVVSPVAPLITPRVMRRSVVMVPVLSKKAWVIFPAKGTRYGSVQKTC